MKKAIQLTFKFTFIIILLLITNCKKDELVKVTNLKIGSVTTFAETTATVGAQFIDVSPNVSAFGHCWATSSFPEVTDGKTNNSGTAKKGDYTSNLTGLSPNTKYYVKAYAMDNGKAVYSADETSFTTLAAKYINITAPVATDIWEKGSTQTIKWDDNIDENVTISLLKAGIVDREIIASTESDGSYNWSLPTAADLMVDTDYSIKITSVSNSNITNESNNFTISALLPTVTTDAITDITFESASSGGNISSDGGDPITARGVCWSTFQNPTTTDDHLTNGNGTGTFTIDMTGLTASTKYYVRAYATNSVGTAYGNQQDFTTLEMPYITVTSPTSDSLWEMAFIGRIEWEHNITENVKIELLKGGAVISEIEASITNSGSYNWTIPEGMEHASNYQIKISNVSDGSIEALSDNFEIFGTISDYEGNEYRIIKIGDQWWMRENLRSTKYSDGTDIPLVTDTAVWSTLTNTSRAYCYYNNNSSNADPYGALYTWYAAMNGSVTEGVQGVCPTGTHLPSDAEWNILEIYLGVSEAGDKLKETGTSYWNSGNTGTNSSEFSALGAGYRTNTGYFYDFHDYAQFWTSTIGSTNNAYYREIKYNSSTVYRNEYLRTYGKSVRCILY